jgi:hypothetical protein
VELAGKLLTKLPILLSPRDRYTSTRGYFYDDPLTDLYCDILVDIIVESHVVGNTFFPTEKTIRPMVGNKPFVVYGPANYLNNLKQLGFRTFDDVWDESYDQYEGPQRWFSMRGLIDQLAQISSTQWTQILQHCAQITQHNRSIVRKIIYDLKGI